MVQNAKDQLKSAMAFPKEGAGREYGLAGGSIPSFLNFCFFSFKRKEKHSVSDTKRQVTERIGRLS